MTDAGIIVLFGLIGGTVAYLLSRDRALVTPFGVLAATVGFICVAVAQPF